MYFECGYDHEFIVDKYFAQHKIIVLSQWVVMTAFQVVLCKYR